MAEDERSCIYTAKKLLDQPDIQIIWIEDPRSDKDDIPSGHAYAIRPTQLDGAIPLNLPLNYDHKKGLRVGDLRRLLATGKPHVSDITQEVRDTPWDMT